MIKIKQILNMIGRAVLFGIIYISVYIFTLFFDWPIPDIIGVSRAFIAGFASKIIEELVYSLIRGN
jgi:hypothetical protein